MTIDQKQMRVLGWEGCLNIRDLGGYPTKDGHETHWGALVRADNLALLSEAGQAALVEYGIRSIVDLRLPPEVEAHPNPFAAAGSHAVIYRNISLVDPAAAPPGEFTSLAKDYMRVVDTFQSGIGEIMKAIARAPEGGVLFHCMAGKDRTGIIAALLLDLAGVPRETIGADYELTAECLRPGEANFLENGPGERADRERSVRLHQPTAAVMVEVLEHIDQRYGGVEAYLRQASVTAEEIVALRYRLVPIE